MSSTGSSVSTSGLVLPSTPLAEPGKEVPLVVNTPNRAKPPRHWIDLSIEERVQAVKDFGVPAFRARQISAHVFERWVVFSAICPPPKSSARFWRRIVS